MLFPAQYFFLEENQIALSKILKSAFQDFLTKLSLALDRYFPAKEKLHLNWVRNPFIEKVPQFFTVQEAEQFVDLSTDSNEKFRLQPFPLVQFRRKTIKEYPLISTLALRVVIPFTIFSNK